MVRVRSKGGRASLFYTLVKAIAFVLFKIAFRVKVIGASNVPLEGKLVLCANHMSNWDPIVLAAFFPRKIAWMGKKELFQKKLLVKPLSWLGVFPVDRQIADISAVKTALRVLKEERVLGIFPEGTRVKEFKPENAKAGVALLAVRAKAPVLPVFITSTYKLFGPLVITIGEPEDYAANNPGKLDNEKYTELSQDILTRIYSLGG